MTLSIARWHPGTEHILVWEGGAALLSSSLTAGEAAGLWQGMRQGASIARFLEILAETRGTGLLDLPPFAIVLIDEENCHLAVRGDFRIIGTTTDGSEEFSGAGMTTWFERRLPRPENLLIVSDTADGDGLPIVGGVVAGGALSLGEPESRVMLSPATAGVPVEPTRGPAEPDVEPEDLARAEEDSDAVDEGSPHPDADVDTGAEVDVGSADPAVIEAAPMSFVDDPRQRETRLEGDVLRAPESVSPPAAPSENRYAALLSDESILVDAEAAAVREELDHPAQPLAGKQREVPDHNPGSGDLPNHPPVSSSDLHDGHTIFDFEAIAGKAVGAGPDDALAEDDPEAAPIVLASFCERGHANPPQRQQCRVCEAPVEERTEQTPRPALGRIRVSSGEIIELAGPIVAGRSPNGSGFRGGPPPRLLALPHPHVSGNHLEFTLEGWTVLARDLASRNGSYLRRSGKPPMRLPETALPLVSGDILDLGHGVFLYLEQLP